MSIYLKTIFKVLFSFLAALLFAGCSSSSTQKASDTKPKGPIAFSKHIVHEEFISEGVAVGDINQDGRKDLVAGFYWFEAPDWTPHEIMPPEVFDYTKGYSHSFLNFLMDVDFDGWLDFISIDFPGEGVYWYKNPGAKDMHWEEHLIDSTVCNESPMMADLDNNGRMDLVFGHESTGTMVWRRAPDSPENLEWESIPISADQSPGTQRFSHGLGYGDVNGDKRKDIIIREGWWEAPTNPRNVPWKFHEANLGEPCSQMYAYDFDADGDMDIISASAHAFGIWWHEQIPGQNFRRHLIDSSFSQTHGAAFVDMNEDGLPDLITGKRYFGHQGKDPGGLEPAVIYWFELQRDEQKQATWIPHLIDDNSGVGLQVVIEDLNEDGKPDIINSNKKGIIYFLQE